MKKTILLFLISFIIGISSVYADETQTGSNVAPVAIDDTAVTNEDTSVTIDLTSNDTDANGDTLMVTSVFNVVNGLSIVVNPAGTGVVFTPSAYFSGTGSFEYIVSDGSLTDTGKVFITVNPVNNGPVAVDDTFNVTKNTTSTLNFISNDTDVDSNLLQVLSVGNILNGTGILTTSGITFTPNNNFEGTITFEYVVSDGSLTDTGSILINVSSLNYLPVAVNDYFITNINTSKSIDPRVNDKDMNGDILAINSVTQPSHGTSTFTSVSVTYMPNNNYLGSDSFKYTVSDGNGGYSTGTINLLVKENYEDDDNDDDKNVDTHEVQDLQKEFIQKFKDLKNEYKYLKDKEVKKEYLSKKKELREEYLLKLKSITHTSNSSDNENIQSTYPNLGNSAIQTYKNIYNTKYGEKISQMTDEQLQVVIGKIDNLLIQVNNSTTYSNTLKQKYNTMLLSLKQLVQDNISNNTDLNIDSLFQ